MDDKITYWASVTFGAAALLLLVLTVSFVNSNRALQEETAQRQAMLGRAQTLNQVDQGIVQALANAAIKNGDTAARDLLAAQGITIKPNAGATAADDAAANPAPMKMKRRADHKLDKVNEEVLP